MGHLVYSTISISILHPGSPLFWLLYILLQTLILKHRPLCPRPLRVQMVSNLMIFTAFMV